MNFKTLAAKAVKATALAATTALLAMPLASIAQETHEDAVAQTHSHDHHHHTKAKFVAGGTVGGAVVGAKVGGPGGAVVGAGVGAVGGVVANKVHRHHEIKSREEHAQPVE